MRILFYPWFGSRIKNITKYINNYKFLFGQDTVVDVVPYKIHQSVLFSNWKKIRKGEILKTYEKEYDVVHMISGGCIVGYNQMEFFYNKTPKKVIFDSGPFYPCPHLTANFTQKSLKILPESTIKPIGKIFDYTWKLEGAQNLNEEYDEWLHSRYNSLCLLNRNDELLDFERIDKYLKLSKSKLVEMDEEHAFLLKDKELYNQSIFEYLSDV